jgi:predicted Zn-dependent protease
MNKFLYFISIFFILFFSSCKDNRTSYQKANDFFKAKKYEEAIVYFNKSIKDGINDNASLFKKIGISYLNINRLREGEEYIKKALQLSPNDDDIILLYVETLLRNKKYYHATSLLKKLPNTHKKYLMLANAYFLSNSMKDSFLYLDKALSFIKDAEEKNKIKYDFAKKLLSSEQKCIEKNKIFKDLYNDFKDDIDFLKNYYKALICEYKDEIQDRLVIRIYNQDKEERKDLKIEVLNKIIKKVEDKYYFNQLAQTYIKERDFPNARKYIKESKIIDFNQDELLFLEAQIDFYRRRYEQAIEKLTKYLKIKNSIDALKFLAEAEYRINNNYSSISHYKELVKINQYDKSSLYKLKDLYERVGNKEALIDVEYKIKFFYRKFLK